MKKLVSITLILCLAFSTFAQQGRVHSYQGKQVFWQNTPTTKYVEVFKFIARIDYSKTQTAQCTEVITQATVTGGNQKFDAVIITNNSDYEIAIRFTDSTADNSLCDVKKINNIAFYIDCDPVDRYNVVKTKTFFRKKFESPKYVLYSSYQIVQLMCRHIKGTAILIGNDNLHFWINYI